MKFSIKIIIGTTVIIAALFSIGGTYMVNKNFDIAYDNAVESNTREHVLRRYSLESGIRNAIESGKTYSKELVANYAVKMQSYGNEDVYMAVLDKDEIIFSNIDEQIFSQNSNEDNNLDNNANYIQDNNTKEINIKELQSYTEEGAYRLLKEDGHLYMVIASKIDIADDEFSILNMYDISAVFSEKHRQLMVMLRLDILIIVISIICVYALSLLLTSDIKKMIKSSKQIAEGKYDERTRINTRDEIGELSRNFDAMAESVEEHIAKLNDDVKNREEFVSDFSHELKTPMTAMIGYSRMLQDDSSDKATRDKAVDYIYREGKRLETLSQKMLQMMRISSDEIVLGKVYCLWLSEQVEEIVEPLVKNIDFRVDVEECCIKGDAVLLTYLLKNLIENAVKACSADIDLQIKGKVILTGHLALDNSKRYKFTVKDNGVGISKDEIDKITTAFYMVDKSRSRAAGGSGLGLAICDKICRLHNTKLLIDSIQGEGTTIEIEVDVCEEDEDI